MKSRSNIGSLLREMRERKGLTATYVALHARISRQGYINIEAGKSSPRLDNLIAILNAMSAGVYIHEQAGDASPRRIDR